MPNALFIELGLPLNYVHFDSNIRERFRKRILGLKASLEFVEFLTRNLWVELNPNDGLCDWRAFVFWHSR